MAEESGELSQQASGGNTGKPGSEPASNKHDGPSGGPEDSRKQEAPAGGQPDFMPPPPPPPAQKPWESGSGQAGPNLPPHLQEMLKQADGVVARTKLDHDVLKDVLKKTTQEKEIKVAELLEAKAAEPLKPFVPLKFMKATPCKAVWDRTDEKEKVRACQICRNLAYDLDHMEMPEAEELIFKMEGKRNPRLYKRRDGKFLTADCMVGLRTLATQMIITVGGITILIVVLMLALMTPHPPPPQPTMAEVKPASPQESSSAPIQQPRAASQSTASKGGAIPFWKRPPGQSGAVLPMNPATNDSTDQAGIAPQIQNAPPQTTAPPQGQPTAGYSSQPPAMPQQAATGQSPQPVSVQAATPAPSQTSPATQSPQNTAPASTDNSGASKEQSPPAGTSPYVWQRQ